MTNKRKAKLTMLRTKQELVEEIKNRTGGLSNYDQENKMKVALNVILDELEAHRAILEPTEERQKT